MPVKQLTKKDEYQNLLAKHVAVVTFNKIGDGEKRVMLCTLDEKWIKRPKKPEVPKGTIVRKAPKENPEVLRIWDMDKNAWRSFNVNTVTGIQLDPTFDLA